MSCCIKYKGFKEQRVQWILKTLVRQETAPKHNDPFDRMLLAQAKHERLKFITHDSMLPYYEEDCIVRV